MTILSLNYYYCNIQDKKKEGGAATFLSGYRAECGKYTRMQILSGWKNHG
jgi:hypothetical protein